MAQRPPIHNPSPKGPRTRRVAEPRNPEVARVHNSARWQRLRKAKREANPMCEDPFGTHESSGRVVIAEQVHHVVPIVVDPSRAFDWDNLVSVCRACHERMERGHARVHRAPGGGG